MSENAIKRDVLNERQKWSLDKKIEHAKERIIEWYEAFDGKVYVAFSGGKDSTVLLHIVRSIYPKVPAVFFNTGLEFPEILRFVRQTKNVSFQRPKMSFKEIIEKNGYPVISRRISQYIREVRALGGRETNLKRLRLTGIKPDGAISSIDKIPLKWQFLLDAPFKISDKCCTKMKKETAKNYVKKTGRMPYIAIMADESVQRTAGYLKLGCNAFDLKNPKSTPIAIWKEKDIWNYIKKYKVEYSPIYNMGYRRTGCVFCMFGIHLEGTPNRFQLMKKTHPRLWNYCMNELKMAEVLDYLKIPTYEVSEMFDIKTIDTHGI